MRSLSRLLKFVPAVACVLPLLANAALAQGFPTCPVCPAPATTAQTVYYFSPPPIGVPATSVPLVPSVATPLYAAPVYPQPYQAAYYPTTADGPIRTFFRRLLESVSPAPPVVAAPVVNVARAAPSASGYASPAATSAAVYYPGPTVVQRPVLGSPGAYAVSPQLVSPAYTRAPLTSNAAASAPGVGVLGSPSYPPSSAYPAVQTAPLQTPRYETTAPSVLPHRLEYNKGRTRLPDNASQSGTRSIVPVAHRQDRNGASSDSMAASQPANAVADRPDDSGWRAVP